MSIIWTGGQSSLTEYFIIRNISGQVYNGSTFESFTSGNYSTYDIPMTEQGSTGFYSGTFPGTISAGYYYITIHNQSGGSPADGDEVIGQSEIYWTGTEVSSILTISQVQTAVENVLNSAIGVSPTSGSIYERIKAIDDKLPAGSISGFDPSSSKVNLNDSQAGVTIGTVNSLGSGAASQVNSEVVDVLFTDTITELSSLPGSSPNIAQALMLIYMALRNKRLTSTSQTKIYSSAGSIIATADVSDSGSEFTKEKFS